MQFKFCSLMKFVVTLLTYKRGKKLHEELMRNDFYLDDKQTFGKSIENI